MRSGALLLLLALPLAADTNSRRVRTGPVVVLYVSMEEREGSRRLQEIGATVKLVRAGQIAGELDRADILFLPSGWAFDAGLRAALKANRAGLEKFLKRGGGVFIAQPNIDGTIDEFPLKFTVANLYDSGDQTVVETKSPLVDGLKKEELPFPADRVLEHDAAFTVLARGDKSGSPSLLIASWQGGRIVVNTDNDNIRQPGGNAVGACHTSDAALKRQIEWLARRKMPKGR